ncbi:MAG TPA: PQQ-dependent sugar dehydrogenase [Gemmataceae bacterium]|nr:PQQ-dependent sugar dehydrogenase [Gemmataceae bacterium]
MPIEYLAAFLVVLTGVACIGTLASLFLGQGRGRWVRALAALLVFVGGLAAASAALAGRNSVVYVLLNTARFDRNHVASVAAGAMCGLLAAFALEGFSATRWHRMFSLAAYMGAVLFLSSIVLKNWISPYLGLPDRPDSSSGLVQKPVVDGFEITEYAQLNLMPTSIAMGPDNHLYAAGYAGIAYQNGLIVRLDRATDTDQVSEVRVADYVNRPHGIAFHDGALYVSRAGQYCRAEGGHIRQVDTGAITRFRDLKHDGTFSNAVDIVSDLPGAQLPDGLHQNNGIAFDSKGLLYVGVGAPSDHGPPIHEYAGTILQIDPKQIDSKTGKAKIKIFARGVRNPYDVTEGPDKQMFCTDNDANNTEIGDALIHLVEGKHYGHPFNALEGGIKVTGTTEPITRSKPAIEGIAYAPPDGFAPNWDDCLYVASYGADCVYRVVLERHGASYKAKLEHFASIPGALDLIVVPSEKAMYVCSHEKRKIYKIVPSTKK